MVDGKLIKNSGISDEDLEMLREKFVHDYAQRRGWDPEQLTTDQLLEIKTHKGYRTPGLILS